MRLPIAIHYNDEIYIECEFKKPKSGQLANTLEVFQNQGDFQAILEFISSSIISFTGESGKIIEQKDQIRAICRKMSYISAEVVAIKIMLLINKEDWIEGIYICPRCGKEIIIGNDSDNIDKISDLLIENREDTENVFFIDLSEPIKIMHGKTNNVLQEVNSFHMHYPTLDNCINGSSKYSQNREIKRQFAIYSDALEKIDGDEIDIKWRRMWGELIFREMDMDDLSQVSAKMQEFGIDRYIEKICNHCGKVWKSSVNTSNFFVSGLRSV